MPSALERVREVARRDRKARFTALLHQQYGERLEDNLRGLHARLLRGAYRAKPSRRAYIAKTDGRQRPLGIAAVEDKIVQAAVVEAQDRGSARICAGGAGKPASLPRSDIGATASTGRQRLLVGSAALPRSVDGAGLKSCAGEPQSPLILGDMKPTVALMNVY